MGFYSFGTYLISEYAPHMTSLKLAYIPVMIYTGIRHLLCSSSSDRSRMGSRRVGGAMKWDASCVTFIKVLGDKKGKDWMK